MKNFIPQTILVIIFIMFFYSENIVSQSCLTNGITFTSQTQIDEFSNDYPNCEEILGNVIIQESIPGDITNLLGLNNLTSFGGTLWLRSNNALTDLSGLENITSIGGDLDFLNNSSLNNLDSLINVTSIGGGLYIEGNIALMSLSGLDNIIGIVAGYGLDISGNDLLTNVDELENITSVNGNLWIRNNSNLNSLFGLRNLTSITGNLRIEGNDSLSNCEEQSICNYILNGTGFATVFNNQTGCNNTSEIESACQAVSIEKPYKETLEIILYPNPTTQEVKIIGTVSDQAIIQTFNTNNQLILKEQINKQKIIDFDNQPSGIYIITIQTENQIFTNKVMVE